MAMIDQRGRKRFGTRAGAGLLCALAAPVLTVGVTTRPAVAQTAPVGEPVAAVAGFEDDTGYNYTIKLPASALAVIQAKLGSPYFSEEKTVTLNGRSRKVVSTIITWPNPDFINDSGFAFVRSAKDISVSSNDQWANLRLGSDAAWKASAAKLQQASYPTAFGWRVLTLRYLVLEKGDPESFVIPLTRDESIRKGIDTRLEAFRETMGQLATSTAPGGYFASALVPTELDAMRQAMLAYGNTERRTATFRKIVGSKVATELDLSKPYGSVTQIDNGTAKEPVYEQPNMQLDPELNKMAQWQAEALAAGKATGHDYHGEKWGDNPMSNVGNRATYFNLSNCCAEIAGGGGIGEFPYAWMAGDTHYRWYFGVDGTYPRIGYGAAKSPDGVWHYVGVARQIKPTAR